MDETDIPGAYAYHTLPLGKSPPMICTYTPLCPKKEQILTYSVDLHINAPDDGF